MKDKTYFLIFLIGCIILILGIIITIFLLLTEDKKNEPEKDDWNQYNCYIFSIVWPPSFCYNKKSDNELCYKRIKNLGDDYNFIIYGLWPSYNTSGRNTEICNKNEEINITFDDELYRKDLSHCWPGLYSSDQNMWNDAYNKHGYCYIERIGKNPEKDYKIYFDLAQELIIKYNYLMEEILPYMGMGLNNVSKTKFKKLLLLDSSQHIDPSTYSLICIKNENTKSDILNEIRFNYALNFSETSNIKSSENCPENFQLYFSDNEKEPVYQFYDFYSLTLSWYPSFCKKIGKECYKKIKEKELNIFMINGLYPSFSKGKDLQICNIAEDIEVKIEDFNDSLKYNLTNYWIGLETSDYEYWKRDYNDHGYCYLQRDNMNITNTSIYFQKVIDLVYTYDVKNLMKELYPEKFPGLRKFNKTHFKEKLTEKYNNYNAHALKCFEYTDDFYLLQEIRLKLDLRFNLVSEKEEYKIDDNCTEEFYAEILEVEGPQKQAEGFYEVYDMYFFTILWLGTTCLMKGEQCYEDIINVPNYSFTMHGLWPNFRNGTLADWCNGKNDIEIEIHDKNLSDFMNTYYISGYHTNAYFWGHEYNKHGYCYNQRNNLNVKDYELYFKKIKDIFLDYDFANIFIDIYKDRIKPGDMEINRTEVESYFEKKNISKDKYLLVCTNITNNSTEYNPHLLEIRIRFDLDFKLLPNETDVSEFDCPEIFYANFYNKNLK